MEDKTFQYSVLGGLILLVLILVIGFGMKKTKTDAGTSIAMFGKTIYKSKELKENLENSDEKEKVAKDHKLEKVA